MWSKRETVKVECFKYREKEHKYRECPLWKGERNMQVIEEAMHMAMPQEAQQKKWKKSPVSQISFSHISTNSSIILTVSMATESP